MTTIVIRHCLHLIRFVIDRLMTTVSCRKYLHWLLLWMFFSFLWLIF